jgi:glyoxylase-like metal-dependent hydrolase (beta-lactamase superfamily II)
MTFSNASRRDFVRALIGSAVGCSFTYSALGQAAPPPIKATRLAENLVLISGDGGNMALILDADGSMLIDSGFPERAAELQKAIAEVDSHKVRMLFNTHWHFDHIGLNETLGKSGTKIIAHENAKKWMSQKVTIEAMNRTFEPLKPEGRPVETFTKGGKMTFGTEKIEYASVPPAHTDGDAYLFFPGPNVLHTGDLFFNGFYPVIDYSTNGWIGGMVAAKETMLKAVDAQTRIIPGHGPLATKDDLKTTHAMLQTVSGRLEAMAKEGKSVDEVVAAAPTKDFDDKYGKGIFKPDQWVRIAYTSVLRHQKSA